jgi:PAS domain S-box-containing protein
MKVLIVDDQFENSYILETILKGNGHMTVTAANGAEGLEAAGKEVFDLIIADILMPVMDGFNFCREVKKNKDLSAIPFIFYTATYTDPKDEEFALSLGADRFVLKPQDPDELMTIIEDVIGKAKNGSNKKEESPKPENVILKEYNQVLIHKLEDKMLQLERSEREIRENNIQLKREIEDHKRVHAESERTFKALRESEERFRSVTKTAYDAIITTESNGKIVEWNQGAEKIFGYSEIEIVGENLGVVIPARYFEHINKGEKYLNQISYNKAIGKTVELIGKHKNGTEFPIEMSLAEWETASGLFFTGIVRDITDRKKSEKDMKMLAHSIESIAECVSITDADDIIIFINDAFAKTYGYYKEELIGQHISIVRPGGGKVTKNFQDILPRTIEGGWRGEVINQKKDGTLFPIFLSTSVVKDERAKPIALIGVATDITELQKSREELILAKEKAELADKLKSEFLAQMSHEIRTPINTIIGNIDFLKESVCGSIETEIVDSFNSIDLASKRVVRTIDLILGASELEAGSYRPDFVNVKLHSAILTGLYKEYQPLAKEKGLEFIYECRNEDASVLIDEYSVIQIFSNLIDNAVKYTLKGKIELFLGKNENGNVIVEVKDTGIGMSSRFLENIFKPFTQEEQGYSRAFDGNGLGLANVKKYCDMNYASIEVNSQKNAGSVFRVTFKR